LFGNLEPATRGEGMLQAHHKETHGHEGKDVEVWVTESGARVNYSSGQVSKIFQSIFDRAAEQNPVPELSSGQEPDPDGPTDFSTLTPHDVRVAFVGWVIRCKGLEGNKYAELGGRWQEASTAFNIYMGCGSRTRQKYIAQKKLDPIFERKPFPPFGLTYASGAKPDHSGGQRPARRKRGREARAAATRDAVLSEPAPESIL